MATLSYHRLSGRTNFAFNQQDPDEEALVDFQRNLKLKTSSIQKIY